jgi:chaperone BCS1
LKEYLGNASEYQIRQMFLRFYDDQTLADQFVEKIKGKNISTASLQGHFVYYKDKPQEAVDQADSLWNQL